MANIAMPPCREAQTLYFMPLKQKPQLHLSESAMVQTGVSNEVGWALPN
jgi:hypothetical protein